MTSPDPCRGGAWPAERRRRALEIGENAVVPLAAQPSSWVPKTARSSCSPPDSSSSLWALDGQPSARPPRRSRHEEARAGAVDAVQASKAARSPASRPAPSRPARSSARRQRPPCSTRPPAMSKWIQPAPTRIPLIRSIPPKAPPAMPRAAARRPADRVPRRDGRSKLEAEGVVAMVTGGMPGCARAPPRGHRERRQPACSAPWPARPRAQRHRRRRRRRDDGCRRVEGAEGFLHHRQLGRDARSVLLTTSVGARLACASK